MIALFIKLLLAHFIGDFLLQPKNWVENKEKNKHKSIYLYAHVGMHMLLILLVLQFRFDYFWAISFIPITHLLIDAWKLIFTNKKNARNLFFIDQFLHLAVIGLVSFAYFPDNEILSKFWSAEFTLFAVCLLFATFVSNIIMMVVLSKWTLTEENNRESSLEQAGKYIGILERSFIFLMIIANYPLGVGFLITAKSVFRYNDLTRAKDRRLTEYVLIGSLMSFGLAIVAGLGYKYFKQLL